MDAGHEGRTPSPPQDDVEEMEVTTDMLLGVWVPYTLAHKEDWAYEDDHEEPVRMPEDWAYEDDRDEPICMPESEAERCTVVAEDSTAATVSSATLRSGDAEVLMEDIFEAQPECDVAALATDDRVQPCDSADDEATIEEELASTELSLASNEVERSPESSTVRETTREAKDVVQDKPANYSEAAEPEFPNVTDEAPAVDACSPSFGDDEGDAAARRQHDFEARPGCDVADLATQQHVGPRDSTNVEVSREEATMPAEILLGMSQAGRSPQGSTVLERSHEAEEDVQDKLATSKAASAKWPDTTFRSAVADACSSSSDNDEGNYAEFAGEDAALATACVLAAEKAQEKLGSCESFVAEDATKEGRTAADTSPVLGEMGNKPEFHSAPAPGRIEDGMLATNDRVEHSWLRPLHHATAIQAPAVQERLPLRRALFHNLPAIKTRRGRLDARASSAGGSTRDSSTRSPGSAASSRSWLQERPVISANVVVDAAELTPRTDVNEQGEISSRQSTPLSPVNTWAAFPECGRVPAMSLLPAYAVRPKPSREQSASRHAGRMIEPLSKAATRSAKSPCQPWQLKPGHDRCTKGWSGGRGTHPEFENHATVRLPPLLPAKSTSGYSGKKVLMATAESTTHSVTAAQPVSLRAWRRSRSAACTDPVW